MESDNPFISNYSIHGIRLRLNTNNAHIHSSIDELLSPFNSKNQALFPDINFSLYDSKYDDADIFAPPSNSKVLYAPSENDKFDIKSFGINQFKIYINPTDATYYIDLGHTGHLSYNLTKSAASGYLNKPESIHPRVISSTIFFFVFYHLLKSKGYFLIHCSGVEREGKGVLIPGFAGAGKTTSCISLIRSGYGLLGDDRPILHYGKDKNLELLSFPEDINVTEKTIDFFPELAASKFIKKIKGQSKKCFSADDIYPGAVTEQCCPKAILYPEIVPERKSALKEIPKSEALSLFLPHSMVVFDKETSRRHFDTLFDLIMSSDTYRLKLGADILDLPNLVESIL